MLPDMELSDTLEFCPADTRKVGSQCSFGLHISNYVFKRHLGFCFCEQPVLLPIFLFRCSLACFREVSSPLWCELSEFPVCLWRSLLTLQCFFLCRGFYFVFSFSSLLWWLLAAGVKWKQPLPMWSTKQIYLTAVLWWVDIFVFRYFIHLEIIMPDKGTA